MKVENLVFNHFYRLKHDIKRSYIFGNSSNIQEDNGFIDPEWFSRIHPVYAMMFSFFSEPIEFDEAIHKLSYFFSISIKAAQDLITPFINNQDSFHTEYNGVINNFPKNLIINSSRLKSPVNQYIPDQFCYNDLDFEKDRLFLAPKGIVFMVNNTCVTQCAYCYADKKTKSNIMAFDQIKRIIDNARNIGVADFSIVGGEFFLFKKWRSLLSELIKNNFKPSLISTKVPISEKIIKDFQLYDIPIQISLDSLNQEDLIKILKVNSTYLERIKSTIILLNKYKIRFQIATVLTTYNDSISNLENIYSFIKDLAFLSRWEIRLAFKSLYSMEDFDSLKISKESITTIASWIFDLKKKTTLNILWSPDTSSKYFKGMNGSRSFLGSKCSANYTHMVLLPDGKVTICEQLYWNPRFIIGDLTCETIEDVWNSSKAKSLASPRREEFSDKSMCKACTIFDSCFAFQNKCFADVLKAYGKQNWDYPDPRCSRAPEFDSLFHN